MPHIRRPVRPHRPHRNLPPIPANPVVPSPIATTVLPSSFTLVTGPPRLPTRPVSGHPLGTFLTVPTVGPLPPVPGTIVTAVVPHRHAVAAPHGMVHRPRIPGLPPIRVPHRRIVARHQ